MIASEIKSRVAPGPVVVAVTVTVAWLTTPPKLAVMVVVPLPAAVANPDALTVAIEGTLDAQVA